MFTFISFNVTRSEIQNLGELFRIALGKVLLEEDFNGKLIQCLVNEGRDIQLSKTNNRKVLGVMVDHVKNAQWMIEDNGGLEKCDLSCVIKKLNRTPLLTQHFSYSIEEFKRILGVSRCVKI